MKKIAKRLMIIAFLLFIFQLFIQPVLADSELMLEYFYNENCGSCIELIPIVDQIDNEYNETVLIFKKEITKNINNYIEYESYLENVDIPAAWLSDFLGHTQILINRQVKEEKREIDIRPFISEISQGDQKLQIVLDTIEGRSAKITEVLQALLDPHHIDQRTLYTQRTGQFIAGEKLMDPLEVLNIGGN